MQELIDFKQNYLKEIDNRAKRLARNLSHSKQKTNSVTNDILKFIIELYDSENNANNYFNKEDYKSSGHQAITSDFEFFISRILYHYSKEEGLDWEINLRCQKKDQNQGKQIAPDILITDNKGKIVAIIEIKVKAGYMQCFFSKIRADKERYILSQNKQSKYNPEEVINKYYNQLKKYYQMSGASKKKTFVLLPTFILVSRKDNKEGIKDFKKQFQKNSTLNKDNLIILSNNKDLDLSKIKEENYNKGKLELNPTDEFEKFIKNISKKR